MRFAVLWVLSILAHPVSCARHEHEEENLNVVTESAEGYPNEEDATNLIDKLSEAVLTKKGDQKALPYLQKLFENCKSSDAVQAAGKLFQDGFECLLRRVGVDKHELFMPLLGFYDSNAKAMVVTPEAIEAAILGEGVADEREQIVKAVWKKFTGEDPDTSKTAVLTEDQLVCRKPKTRSAFILWMKMHGNGYGKDFTFDTFSKYYLDHLGPKIKSHKFFMLMMVNAWHMMDPPYDQYNTVNLRVRAVKEGEASNAGKIYTLIDDCGEKDGERDLCKDVEWGTKACTIIVAKARLEAQEGTTFKSVTLSDKA